MARGTLGGSKLIEQSSSVLDTLGNSLICLKCDEKVEQQANSLQKLDSHLFDFKKAYDSINRDHLFSKLKNMQIGGLFLENIKAKQYLMSHVTQFKFLLTKSIIYYMRVI